MSHCGAVSYEGFMCTEEAPHDLHVAQGIDGRVYKTWGDDESFLSRTEGAGLTDAQITQRALARRAQDDRPTL